MVTRTHKRSHRLMQIIPCPHHSCGVSINSSFTLLRSSVEKTHTSATELQKLSSSIRSIVHTVRKILFFLKEMFAESTTHFHSVILIYVFYHSMPLKSVVESSQLFILWGLASFTHKILQPMTTFHLSPSPMQL